MQIEDGTGSGRKAGVNSENELETRAISEDIVLHQVEEGEAFNINTGLLVLTDATADTAVLYIKNEDSDDMVLTSVTISTGPSTGGADDQVHVKQVGGFSSASDIIVNGADGVAINRNAGKVSRQFSGIIKIGGTGRSFTGAVPGQQTYGNFTASQPIPLTTVIPVGGEAGVTVTPPVSNTNMPFMLSVNFHILEVL